MKLHTLLNLAILYSVTLILIGYFFIFAQLHYLVNSVIKAKKKFKEILKNC